MCQQFIYLFLRLVCMSNFFSVPSVFHQFFARIALGDVDLHFSLMLVRTAILLKGETKWSAWLYYRCNPVHTRGWWRDSDVTFGQPPTQEELCRGCSMPNHIKPKIITYCQCHIFLNQKLLRKFEKWCKFSGCVKVRLYQKKSCKMRPAFKFKYLNSTFSERKSHTKCSAQDNVLCGVNWAQWLIGLIFVEGSIRS